MAKELRVQSPHLKNAEDFSFQIGFPLLIPWRFGAQLTTYALTLDIELVSIWILRLWARISEDLGAIEVTELNWIGNITTPTNAIHWHNVESSTLAQKSLIQHLLNVSRDLYNYRIYMTLFCSIHSVNVLFLSI